MNGNGANTVDMATEVYSRTARKTSSCLFGGLVLVLLLTSYVGVSYAQGDNRAIDFDGTDDTVITNGTLDPADQGTMEFWINSDAGDSRRAMGGHDAFEVRLDTFGGGYVIDHHVFHGGDDVLQGTIELPFGEWHHAACTWDLSTKTAQIYVDGELDTTGDQADDDPGSFTFTIGTRTGQNKDYFDGRLDEIRIWSEVRTQEQIRKYMNQQISDPENEPTLMAYWRFDEASGGDCIDHSGNGFDGKMNNMDPATDRIISEVEIGAAVLPAGKLSTVWGGLKGR